MGSPDIRARAATYAALLACAVALIWHAAQYWFVTDDAYISFVYARNLAEHGELVFNRGADPVEGYTNFSWTVLLGLLMIVGLAPEHTSLVLGVGFGLAGMAVAYLTAAWALGPRRTASESPWALVAPALLGLSAGFACWSSGGLETQLFTFLASLSLYAYVRGSDPDDPRARRWLRGMGVVLALAAMTRPEGLLVAGVLGLHRLALNLVRDRRLRPNRDELACIGWFAVVWAPWYAWRWWYYGYPFPNTYYVKAAGEPPAGYVDKLVDNGVYYVWQWLRQTRLVYAAPVALLGLLAARPRSRRFTYGTAASALAAVYLIYTVRVGGDFMGLHRFVMPLFVIAAVGVALGLAVIVRFALGRVPARARAALAVGVALAVLAVFALGQYRLTVESLRWGNFRSDRGIDTPAFLRVYALDRATIGRHMRDCFRDDDFSIVGGAGAQPFAGRMRAIDVFGLVSEDVAHQVRPTNPRAGHNKWAPNRLLLEHEPEFVFACYSIHEHPRHPRFNCRGIGFWLGRGYEKVTLHVPGLLQQGEYYTFLVRRDRAFECPGRVD